MGCQLGNDPKTCLYITPVFTCSVCVGGHEEQAPLLTWDEISPTIQHLRIDSAMDVDGRKQDMMMLCTFGGNQYKDNKKFKCKHFKDHSFEPYCRFYRKDLGGGCDCSERIG
jgi:hypothetical protein